MHLQLASLFSDPASKTLAPPPVFTEVLPRARFKDSEIPLCKENFSQNVNRILKDFYSKELPAESEIHVRRLNKQTSRWCDLSSKEQKEILDHHHRGGITSLTIGYEGPKFCEPHIPRWTHGLMHATRVGLLVRMIANMYNKYSTFEITEKEILLAQYLAVFHDSARQAEGVDVWDDESAENAYSYLIELGFTKDVALECVQIIKDKDCSKPNKHILTKLIQCADCIDIMRVYGISGFRDEYLDIFNDLSANPEFCSELQIFKSEFYDFIQKTDQGLFRLYQERHSKDYFGETLSLIFTRPKFAVLKNWYGRECVPPPSDMLEIVFDAPSYPNFGSYTILKRVYGGTHQAYILADKNGDLHFFKEITEEDANYEALGARIASEITAGLAPPAKVISIAGKTGILQEYIEFASNSSLYQPEKLTLDQKIDLLANMIADFVIYNYDTHSLQFGIDHQKQIRGLDKGEAFRPFRTQTFSVGLGIDLETFNPNYWPSYYIGTPTYKIFCQHLKSSSQLAETEKILNSKKVKETFKRANQRPLAYTDQLEKISMNPKAGKLLRERAQKVEKIFRNYFA